MITRERSAARGRANKAAGDALEAWLEVQHDKALHLGILAHVEKTEPHARVIRGKLQYVEKGVADYCGTLEREPLGNDVLRNHPPTVWADLKCVRVGGRSLAVEAKSTSGNRLLKSVVSAKQQRHLEAVARAGGLALLVAEFRSGAFSRRRFAVPWLAAPWSVAVSAEGVSADDLELGGWAIASDCYLQRWHAGGPRSMILPQRKYARE